MIEIYQVLNSTKQMPPRVLVVGGYGFLGRYIIKELKQQGFRCSVGVKSLTNLPGKEDFLVSPFKILNSAEDNFDCIVNAAGYYSRESGNQVKSKLIQANVGVSEALAMTSIVFKIPLITLGSYFEFAPYQSELYRTAYTQAKIAVRSLLESYSSRSAVAFHYIYLYDTYGEGDKRSKILYNLLTPNKVGLENKIRNPEAIINWTHAIDVARGIRKVVELSLSLEDVKFSTHQIRSKDEYKLREIANLLENPDFENLDRQLESSRVSAIWNCAKPLSDEIFSETLVDFIRRNYNWYT